MTVSPLAELIGNEPGMAERLLASHVPDRHGKCRACVNGGQSGNQVWPCSTYENARAAAQLVKQRRRT